MVIRGRHRVAIYLDECMMGRDPAVIGFPHLLICNGLVLRTTTALWGVHLDAMPHCVPLFDAFWAYAVNKGLVAGNITDIYSSCNMEVRYRSDPPDQRVRAWKVEMQRYAWRMGGWRGNAHRFDTSILAPVDGTYVEYHHQAFGGLGCRIFYKKNEKMASAGTQMIPNAGGLADCVVWDTYRKALKASTNMITGNIVTTPGGLRELDYANRLATWEILN
jgi:hypothetical protein